MARDFRYRNPYWTRELEPFGITIHCRVVRDCRVERLRHETGRLVHIVDEAVLEWVTGAPKMHIRYLLVCGDNRSQRRAHLLPSKARVTCERCLSRTKR